MPKYSRNRPWVFRSGPYERPGSGPAVKAQKGGPSSARGVKTASKHSAAVPPSGSTSKNGVPNASGNKSKNVSERETTPSHMYKPGIGGVVTTEHIRNHADEWRKLPAKDIPPWMKGILDELELESTSAPTSQDSEPAASKTTSSKTESQQPKTKTSTTSRKPLEDKSANPVPAKTSKKQPSKSTSKKKTANVEKETSDEVIPMTAEERCRIFKKKDHWTNHVGRLYWDGDLSALAREERRLEGHTLVLKGVAAEVADEGDDDATIIAKLKAAGGWFGDLKLRGEGDKTVPIYDTCVRLKEKIADFLMNIKDPGNHVVFRQEGRQTKFAMSKAVFCSQMHTTTGSLNNFMKKEGTMGGAENGTYFGAYCFFEKKRMWEGAEKSSAREACEEVWWPKGLQLKDSNRGVSFIAPAGYEAQTYIDEDTGEVFFD